MTCVHMQFKADCMVHRLTDGDDGPVTGYNMDVRVRCADCGEQFRFVGLPAGYHVAGAAVSIDGTELRAALVPVSEGCDARPDPKR